MLFVLNVFGTRKTQYRCFVLCFEMYWVGVFSLLSGNFQVRIAQQFPAFSTKMTIPRWALSIQLKLSKLRQMVRIHPGKVSTNCRMSEQRTIQPKTPRVKSNGTEIKKISKIWVLLFSRNSVNCCSIRHGNANRDVWSNEKHPIFTQSFENLSSEISVPLNLPEFTVDAWFTFRKFNNVRIFRNFSRKILYNLPPFRTFQHFQMKKKRCTFVVDSFLQNQFKPQFSYVYLRSKASASRLTAVRLFRDTLVEQN